MALLYVVFSRTECKMGSFIRLMTHGFYNHVSISLDPRLDEVYSFSRLNYHTPFCAGFVREGAERYRNAERIASISVCCVEIDDEHMNYVTSRLSAMKAMQDRYVYNMFSAAVFPLRRTVHIRDAYTCIEFVILILKTAGVELDEPYYSITDLYGLLCPHEIYSGEYPETAPLIDSEYKEDIPVRVRFTRSARQLLRMTVRLVRR